MPAVRLNPVLRVMWKLHRFLLRATRGRVGSRLGGFPVLLLETIGHATGQPRTVSLSHLEDGENSSVVASYAGEERDPAWAKNLRAHPEATITVRGRSIAVVARELEGTRREEMFRRFVERDASYDEYRRQISRRIPVFELRPRDH